MNKFIQKDKISKQEKKDIAGKLIVLICAVVIVGIIYKLNIPCILVSVICTIAIVPNYMRQYLEGIKHRKRYDRVVLYMEQILYSFKKKPKIREALIDVSKTGDSTIKELIEEVIINIDSKMSNNIFSDSLKIIEEEFKCKRIRSIHKFLEKIESQGGEYNTYIDILLNDVKAWNDRTRMFMKDVERIKRNILISIGSTMLTCAVMIHLIPKEYTYTGNIIYQISTLILLILMEVIYYQVLKKMNFDWIREENELLPQQIDRYYKIVYDGAENYDSLRLIEKSNYKTALKKIEKEVKKHFPDWLREIAINLQVETVQSAIEHSFETSAYVMKEPIRRILLDFEEYPVGIEPYDNFLKAFDLNDIKSSMKMLYSMGELGKEETEIQIGSIIDRNIMLENQAEILKNKDKIGVCSFISAIPMLLGVIKIMIDMLLMIFVFTSAISGVLMNGGY